MAHLTVEVSDLAYERLQAMARLTERPLGNVLEDLIAPHFELSRQQLEELDLALAEVDVGEIATDEEAAAFFKKFAA